LAMERSCSNTSTKEPLKTCFLKDAERSLINDRLKKLINSKDIMLFIKGTPQEPECGFSSMLVSIIKEYDYEYGYFNILTDDEVRQGLKEYSKWPIYPQVYAKENFIDGLDIITDLHQENELEDEFKKSLSI